MAFLCVLCMLFTSMPSSVLSDTIPATPTDIQVTGSETPAGEQTGTPGETGNTEGEPEENPAEDPAEEPSGNPEGEPAENPSENPSGEPSGEPAGEEPGNENPENPEEGRGGEPAAEEPAEPAGEEPAGEEPAAEEPAEEIPADETPSDETSEEEPEEEKEKIPANRELVIGDDETITGELTGEKPADYLIRFSTNVNQIMFVFLKSDKELTATVTDEETDKVINFKREETEQGEPVTLTVEYTKFKSDRTYLVRISAAEEASFSLRLVKKSILAKELEARAAAEAAGDEQPADEQPADQQPADEQPADEQPADEQPADEQPADEQPADEQPADEQPADEQPADEQPADEQPVDEQPADEQPADEQPVDEQPADEQPADEQPADEQPADEQPADEQPADEQPADEQPADEQPADEQPADEQPVDEQPADEQPVDEELIEEELIEEELTEEELTEEELTEEELTEEETEETPATPTDLEPVEIRLDAAESGVEAWITYMSDAGIPEGAELHVRELDAGEQEAYQAQTARALNCDDESYLRYTKYLEFTLTCEGEALELNAPVTAYVTLPDVSEGLEALQVVRFGGAAPELMDSGREGDTVSFGTDSFAVFGIGNALISITANETELAAVEVLGFSPDAPVSLTKTEDPEVEEGLEVLGTFTIENNTDAAPEAAEQDGLWIKAELKQDAELDSMEGVALYRVEEDGSTDVLMEELSGNARIMELDALQVAIVKDTGYRHLTLTVNPEGTEEAQSITLDGMMPKGSEAAAEDVTDRFADYVSPEARTESGQPEEAPRAVLEASGSMEVAKKAAATKAGAAKAAETKAAAPETAVRETVQEGEAAASSGSVTLAAYEISISHRDGEYQPDEDKPISVEIVDSRITAGKNIEVWHIRDDGTEEKVENFTVEEGKISFEATGFSVYVVIAHEDDTEVVEARVEFHFISDDNSEEVPTGGSVYYVGDRYWFKNKSENTNQNSQTTQILKDGESLELIADPPNELVPGDGQSYKYFYGWYVVNPHTISGTTNAYGIGTSDSKLYYEWPLNPSAITFESPISISVDNSGESPVVSWSLNGVSGTGTPDKDGTVHVLLAPVFDKYNFVNFLLYAKDTDVSPTDKHNLMARKLIVMGSVGYAEVKVSDIHATSRDPVHLIFMGWEYEDESSPTGWTQILTIDSSGHELSDPGKDGVYLTVLDDPTAGSIDLYPIFVEARWVDFNVGPSGCGATYVASEYLEAWGPAMPEGSVADIHSLNCFTSLNKSVRQGYKFDGWYAFANTDSNGNITNLTQPENVTFSYVDVNDKYSLKTVTVNTTAIQVGESEEDGEDTVSIYDYGPVYITENGLSASGTDAQKLFSCVDGKLKLYDALDRLGLTARWTPAGTKITVVYWTENAQGANYVAPADPKDDYTSNAVRTVTTDQLNEDPVIRQRYGENYFHSGSEIKRDEHLSLYTDTEFGVTLISNEILDDVGAVTKRADGDTTHAREEIFYQLNYSLSDTNKIINGDGETIINLYFERKTFKLVFHIGRDGYLKNAGRQRQSTADGNWIQYMYKDDWVNNTLGYTAPASGVSNSYSGYASMTYNGRTYDSSYVTTRQNVLDTYVPGNGENVYIIEAKYGADISSRWPSPANPAFTFYTNVSGKNLMPYIWTSYYETLYTKNANDRPTTGGNTNGTNPDINGIYRYMSAELCSNRTGDKVVGTDRYGNENRVHHLVAWFGQGNNTNRFKRYHFLYEAIEGTYDPNQVTLVSGDDYAALTLTTWSQENTAGDRSEIIGHTFYEASDEALISNLEPQYQLASDIDGYDVFFSCYNPTQKPVDPARPNGDKEYDIYFFYRPRQYTLTFMYENENDRKTDTYYYTQSLADANQYPEPQKEGYEFIGWYTNEAGVGEPFDFSTATMPNSSVVLYPVMKILRYLVKIDPNGGVIDHIDYGSSYASGLSGQGHKTSQSTYFNGTYGTPIGEYTVTRDYILLSAKELTPGDPNYYTGDKYYYINMQAHPERTAEWGDWGLHSDLRDAVYLKCNADSLQNDSGEIRAFHNYYMQLSNTSAQDPNGYTGVHPLQWTDFLSAYVSGPYRRVSGENYTFMGWYEVKDGKVSSMPFNFNDPVTGELELRAKWRLDGGYYIQYNPYFFTTDEHGDPVAIIGEIEQWTDPADPTLQLYADQSPTQILRAPTNVSSTDTEHTWVFRGWRVVRADGSIQFGNDTYTDWTPIEYANGNPVYYQPGDHFTVDSDLATGTAPSGHSGHIIYMQAYYEPEELSERRPEITNLILDSNDAYLGYVNTTDSGALPALDHPGVSAIKTDGELYNNHPTQILFGDIQSNLAVHLFRYATAKTNAAGVTGTNFFSHDNNFKLIGFDENADPNNPTTGHAYVPAFAADGVIAVTRNDHRTLYAMWEPMVYVTFVNDTGAPISIALSGTDLDTVSIVNEVTGEFARQPASSTLNLEAGERVKIALPKADVTGNAETSDSIIATVINDHLRKKMSVSGEYPARTAYGTGSTDIKYGQDVTYSGKLVIDPDGIVVTYTEEPDAQILYDVNGGTWTDACPPYQHLSGDIYDLDTENLHNNQYEPTDPTRAEKKFIGWTIYPEIAGITNFSSTNPLTVNGEPVTIPSGSIQLDVVRDNYLWDFSRDASELYDNNKTLYAVWSDTVTVKFNIVRSQNMNLTNSGIQYHIWNGPVPETVFAYDEFYLDSEDPRFVTYTLAKGDRVNAPEDPSPCTNVPTWNFMYWLIKDATHNNDSYRHTAKSPNDDAFGTSAGNIFDFTQRVLTDTELVTSWTASQPQTFTFTIKNEVVNGNPNDEFEYEIKVDNDYTLAKIRQGKNEYGHPTERWGSVTTNLKNNEEYTVLVTVYWVNKWSGIYNTEIKVTDRDGTVIKDSKLFYCKDNTHKDFVSDYKYTLTVTQSPAAGYTTTVLPDTDHQVGTIELFPPFSERTFEFGSTRNVNSQAQDAVTGEYVYEYFRPQRNIYSTENLTNSLTVVFRNEAAAVVAPTGFTSVTKPFVLMLLAGLLLLAGIAVPVIARKRRHVKAEACEAVQINYPGTMPPCPRANLWTQPTGTSGKRGGSV